MTPIRNPRGLAGLVLAGHVLAGLVLAVLVLAGTPRLGLAQWGELTAGTEASPYLYAMQLRGWWGGESSAIRPVGPRVVQRWMRDSVGAHPWQSRFTPSTRALQLLRPTLMVAYVGGDFPWSVNDGALWQGLGVTTAVSMGLTARLGPVSLRLQPLLFRTENRGFALDGDTTRGRTPFADAARPCCIDLPQRFGRSPYARLDPGQSELRVELGPVVAGLSTRNISWGPGLRHSLLFTGNGPGVPHLFLGTSEAWRTPLGRLSGQLLYGKASPSGVEPAVAVRDRLVTGLVASWQPPSGRGLEIGAARLYHKFWPADGFTAHTLLAPFGSLFTDLQYYYGGDADNQLLSFFARWRSEAQGLEVYGEFGRNDRSIDLRDVVVEPEQNSAWLVGFAKSTARSAPVFWLFRGDIANGRIGSISRTNRPQVFFYEHAPITQGHTQRGQLIGTSLLERTGGMELAADRYAPNGRLGLLVTTRAMPPGNEEGVLSTQARTQWALEASAVRFVGAGDVTLRLGWVVDVNRAPGHDGHAAYLSVGSRWGF
ncbi:MAG: hypothetical protein WCK74_03285 [Gemmatimonadaceae bacterium]